MDDTNRCVCCGRIIPEGRMVCRICEKEACMHLWEFQGFEPVIRKGRARRLVWRCARCGKERIAEPVDREWVYPSMCQEE